MRLSVNVASAGLDGSYLYSADETGRNCSWPILKVHLMKPGSATMATIGFSQYGCDQKNIILPSYILSDHVLASLLYRIRKHHDLMRNLKTF